VKLRLFLTLATLVFGIFGVGLLAAPGPFMQPFGLSFEQGGVLMSRVLGAALIGFGAALWLSRGADVAAARPLLIGGLIYNLLDLPINILAIQSGAMNAVGWVAVGLHLALAAGFGWFGLSRQRVGV
jgi:hypothetical protein